LEDTGLFCILDIIDRTLKLQAYLMSIDKATTARSSNPCSQLDHTMTTNPSSQLRLGSSLQDFLRILQLDPSNAKDVKLYQTMLVSHSSPTTALFTLVNPTQPNRPTHQLTLTPNSKKSKPAACASATTAPPSCPNSSTTQRSKPPSTERRSTMRFSCKSPRGFTSLPPRRAAPGIIWRITAGGAIVRRPR
jgi:hypothetical protein